MKMNIYAMYDEKAEAYHRPFIFKTDGQAVRAFSDGVKDQQSNLAKHYQDYSLYCIGIFNEETAEIDSFNPVKLICRASEFVEDTTKEVVES
jgi:hypothetical protein